MQLNSVFVQFLAVLSVASALPAPSKTEIDIRSPPTQRPQSIGGFPAKDWKCKTSQKKDTSKHNPLDRPHSHFHHSRISNSFLQTLISSHLLAVTFTGDYIERSTIASIELRDNGDNKAGNSKYPEFITDPDSIPGLEDYKGATNVDHFPLNYDGKTVFTGGTPTSDARVFYQHTVGQEHPATFLGVWTHAGKKDGSFIKCDEQ